MASLTPGASAAEIKSEAYVPTDEDWVEFSDWAHTENDHVEDAYPAFELPDEPTAEEVAWDDGFTSGRDGYNRFPVGMPWSLRSIWEAGLTVGFAVRCEAIQRQAAEQTAQAIDAAGGIGPYLRQEHERRLGLIPADVAEAISRTGLAGHGTGPDFDCRPE